MIFFKTTTLIEEIMEIVVTFLFYFKEALFLLFLFCSDNHPFLFVRQLEVKV